MDEAWLAAVDRIQEWYENHTDHPRQGADSELEKKLARWVNKQRKAFKADQLPPERVNQLEQLTAWSWDPWEDAWFARFESYAEWVHRHGRHPRDSGNAEEFAQSSFAKAQRQAVFGTNTGKMTESRGLLLESIEGWFWRGGYSDLPFSDGGAELPDGMVEYLRKLYDRFDASQTRL